MERSGEEIRLVHVADVHLGHAGSAHLVHHAEEEHAGRYVREVDIERSFERLANTLITGTPRTDVLIIAGDLFDRSTPLPRAVACAARVVQDLTRAGIEVVVIDGNHETSNSLHTGSPTSYLRELGAHVANGTDSALIAGDDWRSEKLRGRLAVHALPFLALVNLGALDSLHPIPGLLNVLAAHGPVKGMSYTRHLASEREQLPVDLLRRGWDYVALGDWHVHMDRPVRDASAYYSGSLEALNFGEACGHPQIPGHQHNVHGAIQVTLREGNPAEVISLPNHGRRPVLDLQPVHACTLSPEELLDQVRQRLSDRFPPEALVRLVIRECPATLREKVDRATLDQMRRSVPVRGCYFAWDIQYAEPGLTQETTSEVTLESAWNAHVEEAEADPELRAWYIEQGSKQIDAARSALRGVPATHGD